MALVGQTLGGRYELYALLGKGGFGAVYATRHTLTGQELVVKVLRANMAQDPTQLRRFLNEAKAACQLTHPNTVRVFDFGQTENKQMYMAMERLNGQEMADVVKAEAPLDAFRVIHIAIGVLKSLSEAHAAGLVHRDLKPGNIFLCDIHGEPDFVKLIDFGIAKSYEGDDAENDLTKTGFAVGTPKYMSPEQGRAEALDGRSDLYSLGIIIYEALCGVVPFKASSAMAMIVKHLQELPAPVETRVTKPLPKGLSAVVMRSLAKHPWERFSDADDMRAALEAVLEHSGRAVPERGRAVSAKFRAVPMSAGADAAAPALLVGATMPSAEPDSETKESVASERKPGPAAKTAAAAGKAMRDLAAQEAATLRIPTGSQRKAAAAAPALAVDFEAGPPSKGALNSQEQGAAAQPSGAAAGAVASQVADSSHASAAGSKAQGPGLNTRLVKGAARDSVVPSTPSRPSRNRTSRSDAGSSAGRFLLGLAVLLALGLGGWWAWMTNKGEDPTSTLSAAATEFKAQVGTTAREPLAARVGTRERVKPKLKTGSKRRKEVEAFHKNRYKGVGGKNEPLSTKEIDIKMDRTDRKMIACVHKYGASDVAVKRIAMDIEVNTKGRVTEVKVDGAPGEGELGKCIAKVARAVRFRSTLPSKQVFKAYVGFPPTKGRAAPKPAKRAAKPVKRASKPAKRAAKPTKRAVKPKFNGDAAL